MKDLLREEDIEFLVHAFYVKLRADELLKHFFNEVIEINWEEHMPRISSFWNEILLDIPGYKGNAMMKHIELDQISSLEDKHVDRWMELWKETIDEHFNGDIANNAKERAHQIAELMKYKLNGNSLL